MEKFKAAAARLRRAGRLKPETQEVAHSEYLVVLDKLHELKAAFDSTAVHGAVTEAQFLVAFAPVLGFPVSKLRMWFHRVDANGNGTVSWDEFSNYLLMQHDMIVETERPADFVPIADKDMPNPHAHTATVMKILCRVTGDYITASRDSLLKVWTPQLACRYTVNLETPFFSDMVAFEEDKTLAVVSLDRMLTIYDLQSMLPIRRYLGANRDGAPSPRELNEDAQRRGSIAGNTRRRRFISASTELLQDLVDAPTCIEYAEATQQPFMYIGLMTGGALYYRLTPDYGLHLVGKPTLHTDRVSQIRWAKSADGILTSSWDGTINLISTERHSVVTVMRNVGTAEGQRSILNFDWSNQLKLVGGCGADRRLRLWNPWMPSPLYSLAGHSSPLLGCVFNEAEMQLISLSEDRVFKVWDIRTLREVQTWTEPHTTQWNDIRTLAFDGHQHRLLGASHGVHIWLPSKSHVVGGAGSSTEPLVAALYNTAFGQAVAVGTQEISVWNAFSSVKNSSFRPPTPITCCCLDHLQRRLVTGTTTGEICVWNHVTGQLLKELHLPERMDVLRVLYVAQGERNSHQFCAITVGGIFLWSDSDDPVERPIAHYVVPGITALAFCLPAYWALGDARGAVVLRSPKQFSHQVPLLEPANNNLVYCPILPDELQTQKDQAVIELLCLDRQSLLVGALGESSLMFWDYQQLAFLHRHEVDLEDQSGSIAGIATSVLQDEIFIWDSTKNIYQLLLMRVENNLTVTAVHSFCCCGSTTNVSYVHPGALLTAGGDGNMRLWTAGGALVGEYQWDAKWRLNDPSSWKDLQKRVAPDAEITRTVETSTTVPEETEEESTASLISIRMINRTLDARKRRETLAQETLDVGTAYINRQLANHVEKARASSLSLPKIVVRSRSREYSIVQREDTPALLQKAIPGPSEKKQPVLVLPPIQDSNKGVVGSVSDGMNFNPTACRCDSSWTALAAERINRGRGNRTFLDWRMELPHSEFTEEDRVNTPEDMSILSPAGSLRGSDLKITHPPPPDPGQTCPGQNDSFSLSRVFDWSRSDTLGPYLLMKELRNGDPIDPQLFRNAYRGDISAQTLNSQLGVSRIEGQEASKPADSAPNTRRPGSLSPRLTVAQTHSIAQKKPVNFTQRSNVSAAIRAGRGARGEWVGRASSYLPLAEVHTPHRIEMPDRKSSQDLLSLAIDEAEFLSVD